MIERDQRTTPLWTGRVFVWANPYPVHLAIDAVALSLAADSANANDGIKLPCTNGAHAIFNAETALFVRVVGMSPFVKQRAHGFAPLPMRTTVGAL
jgi:hypothetical protein